MEQHAASVKTLHLKNLLQDADRCAALVSEFDGKKAHFLHLVSLDQSPAQIFQAIYAFKDSFIVIHIHFRNNAGLQSGECSAHNDGVFMKEVYNFIFNDVSTALLHAADALQCYECILDAEH